MGSPNLYQHNCRVVPAFLWEGASKVLSGAGRVLADGGERRAAGAPGSPSRRPLDRSPVVPSRLRATWRLPLRASVRPADDRWSGPGLDGARGEVGERQYQRTTGLYRVLRFLAPAWKSHRDKIPR